jgi:hypothetical protein
MVNKQQSKLCKDLVDYFTNNFDAFRKNNNRGNTITLKPPMTKHTHYTIKLLVRNA